MAGRIRSIKPELRETHAFACLSDGAARLFLMLYTLADDEGRCPASAGYLNGAVFFAKPRPTNVVGRMLGDLERAGLVVTFKISGAAYLQIVGWHDKSAVTHQRIDKPQPARYPGPESVHSKNGSASGSRTDSRTDLGPPILDRDLDRERDARAREPEAKATSASQPELSIAGAQPARGDTDQPVPTSWQRRKAWWEAMREAHGRLRAAGVVPAQADELPRSFAGINETNLAACERSLREAGYDEQAVDRKMRHVLLVAEAEAMREGHGNWFKPALLWQPERFNRAVDTSLDEARTPRRPASPIRDVRNEPRIIHEEL